MTATFPAPAALGLDDRPSAASVAIELSEISFNYGERRALEAISCVIAEREIFGLLGPNGGGKTTLFKLLSTLVPIQAGDARILGCDLRTATAALRRRLGVVFQHPSVDGKLTVAENLAHHGRLYGMSGAHLRARSAAMLERVDLTARAGELVETLSGGLRRRVELAKALLHQPELLILDEPSTGLDPIARREFLNYLTTLRDQDGITIVLTTHHMEEADRCDRIGLLDEGRMVALAPPGELKSRVGGDVVVIRAIDPETLRAKVEARMHVKAALVDGTLRIERARGHELVRDVVEAFGPEIESVYFGKPTLEDVFVHLTGRRFTWNSAEAGS
ncbi:MAG TPA: ATP-binding cassette domain-containing protein [Candidatus Binataceae bacterium]|nr:ATP-binding cassette domain-containing protein [Candidatus Binataceae bacterium]